MAKKFHFSRLTDSVKDMFHDKSGMASDEEKRNYREYEAERKYLGRYQGMTKEQIKEAIKKQDEAGKEEREAREELAKEAKKKKEEEERQKRWRIENFAKDSDKNIKDFKGDVTRGIKAVRWYKRAPERVGTKTKEILRGQWGEAGQAGGWMFIFFTIVLYMLDIINGFDGINIQRFMDNLAFTSIESYIGWFFNSIVVTLLIAYYVIYRPSDHTEFISWIFVAETISLILFMGGGGGTMLIHLGLVMAFYWLYIRHENKEDIAKANYIFFVLLFFDFFGYGLLSYFINNPAVSNRLIIPIWFYYSLIYTKEQERTVWINFLIIIVILINVFYFMGGIDGLKNMQDYMTEDESQEGFNFWRTGYDRVIETLSSVYDGFQQGLDKQLEYASGGYYKGKVEKNKIGPLGVFIDEVKSSQPRYYTGEEVVLWGKISADSLNDNGINVNVNCVHFDDSLFDSSKYSQDVSPDRTFTIYTNEVRDFECRFKDLSDSWIFDIGIHNIGVLAEFPFETLAYLKSYYMDVDRRRNMVREGLDPFKEFQIQDTDPVATYTDGPVIIGMETTSPIIDVGTGIVTKPRLGITLENKEGWNGKIRSLTELVILTPPGVEIKTPKSDCTIAFEKYSKDDCSNSGCCYDSNNIDDKGDIKYVELKSNYKTSKGSCERYVFKECVDVCIGDDKSKESSCNISCTKNYESCVNDCNILFEGDSDKDYNAYSLNLDQAVAPMEVVIGTRNQGDIFKNIDRFRSFSCRLTTDADKVLESSPFTMKDFRVKARYNYTVTKEVEVQVQSQGGTVSQTSKTLATEPIDITGAVPQKIISYANSLNIPREYALAIAWAESRFKHCNNGQVTYCKGKKYTTTSSDGSSVGVMQVNTNTDSGKENIKSVCGMDPEDMYDLDKNIICGLRILKNKYTTFKRGLTREQVIKNCKDSRYIDTYAGYTGWDAAFRGYNGWGCGTGADVDYVENIKSYVEEIKSKLSEKDKVSYGQTDEFDYPNPTKLIFFKEGTNKTIKSMKLTDSFDQKYTEPEESNILKKNEAVNYFTLVYEDKKWKNTGFYIKKNFEPGTTNFQKSNRAIRNYGVRFDHNYRFTYKTIPENKHQEFIEKYPFGTEINIDESEYSITPLILITD